MDEEREYDGEDDEMAEVLGDDTVGDSTSEPGILLIYHYVYLSPSCACVMILV